MGGAQQSTVGGRSCVHNAIGEAEWSTAATSGTSSLLRRDKSQPNFGLYCISCMVPLEDQIWRQRTLICLLLYRSFPKRDPRKIQDNGFWCILSRPLRPLVRSCGPGLLYRWRHFGVPSRSATLCESTLNVL